MTSAEDSLEPPVPEGPPEHPAIRGLRVVDKVVASVEAWALMLALLGLMGIAIFMSFSHAVWPKELICYLVFFIGLVGGALATHERRLFNIDFVSHFMPRPIKLISRLLGGLFVLVVCVFLIKGGLMNGDAIANRAYEILKPSIGSLALPIGASLIALHVFLQLVFDAYTLATGRALVEKGPVA